MAPSSDEPKTPLEMLSHSGEVLLECGTFADAKIICGDRTWDAHKSIICARCTFFCKAFTGDFEEARTGEMKLQEQDPKVVDWVIWYLYTGKVCDDVLEAQRIRQLADLYSAADYFGISSLQEEAILAMRPILNKVAARIQNANATAKYVEEPDRYFSDRRMGDYFYIAKMAYRLPSTSAATLKKTVLDFLEMTRFVVGKDTRFSTKLQDVPELAVDMVQLLMQPDHQGVGSLVCTDWPARCDKGGKRAKRIKI